MSNNFTIAASSEFVIGQLLPELFMVVNLSIHLFKHNYCFNQYRIGIVRNQDTGFTQILLRDTDRYITNFKVPLPRKVVMDRV